MDLALWMPCMNVRWDGLIRTPAMGDWSDRQQMPGL
jgi:hypothetical protein